MFKKRFFLLVIIAGIFSISGFSSNGSADFLRNLTKTTSTDSTFNTVEVERTGSNSSESSISYGTALAVQCIGGSENFENLVSQSNYSNIAWTGNDGRDWLATDARSDQVITGKAITLRSGSLTNTTIINGGIAEIQFDYKRVFAGNSVLKVYVNGVQAGDDIEVTSETPATAIIPVTGVTGNAQIEIVNSGNRVTIDNLSWECVVPVTPSPEIRLVDAFHTEHACEDEFVLDLGAKAVELDADAVFTIKNIGTDDLVVDSVEIDPSSPDFTIIWPVAEFTLAPGETRIVLVVFNTETAGEKTATLVINSNVASCEVTLKGTGLVVCTAPTGGSVAVNDINPLFAGVTVSGVTFGAGQEGNYVAFVGDSGSSVPTLTNGTNYAVGTQVGTTTVVYNGPDATFDVSGLTTEEENKLFIFAYGIDCTGGPVYGSAISDTFDVPCMGGFDTFSDLGTPQSNYAARTWAANGIDWQATDARTDLELAGAALTLRQGTLSNTDSAQIDGVGTVSFQYKRVFIGESTLKLLVNGSEYDSVLVTSEEVSTFTTAVNIPGNAVIEIVNTSDEGGRVVIDNLSWTCYTAPTGPAIVLFDENELAQTCGSFTLDFGNVAVNNPADLFFIIRNGGTGSLPVDDISISGTLFGAFTDHDPLPASIDPTEDIWVFVTFDGSSTSGVVSEVLTITSGSETCTVTLTANVTDACEAPEVNETIVQIPPANVTTNSAEITIVSGADTADGYVVVVVKDGDPIPPIQNGTTYNVGDLGGAVVYVGPAATFTATGLDSGEDYDVRVFPYNTVDCAGGPVYNNIEIIAGNFTTVAVEECGLTESFTNIGASQSNYTTRNWTGDNGQPWTATDARTDQTLNGRAIAVREGAVSTTIPEAEAGAGTLTFNYKRVFTGNSTLQVYIDNVAVGSPITVSSETPLQASVNIASVPAGDVLLEIRNTGNRVVIDDVEWTCTSAPAAKFGATAIEESNGGEAASLNSGNEIKLYPNPNTGSFRVSFVNPQQQAQVEIYDISGKKVMEKTVSPDEIIALNNAGEGVYLVKVKSGDVITTQKIIVKK